MKLIASVLCHNEMGRFLPLAIRHMLTYCDEVRVIDDGSTDGSYEWLDAQDRVEVRRNRGPGFFHDESMIRNSLLDWTFQGEPTHILAIDADEFVVNGRFLRTQMQKGRVWSLVMREIWKADRKALWTREDGAWRGHNAPIAYRAPEHRDGSWRIQSRKLACGRTPVAIMRNTRDALNTKIDILHFGWTREVDRAARYARYAEHDKGRFHTNAHLRSIMYADSAVRLGELAWPRGMPKDEILERVG